MITKEQVQTGKAPRAVGPYSQAVKAGNFIFISGQLPLDPGSGELIKGDAGEQARQCMNNIMAILEKAEMNADNLVKVTIYLTDLNDFNLVNEIYASFYKDQYPARACIEVSRLPKDANVEIEAVGCK